MRHDTEDNARTATPPMTNHIAAVSKNPMSSMSSRSSRMPGVCHRYLIAMPHTNADTKPLPPMPTLSPYDSSGAATRISRLD
jgi:hypothetical protein